MCVGHNFIVSNEGAHARLFTALEVTLQILYVLLSLQLSDLVYFDGSTAKFTCSDKQVPDYTQHCHQSSYNRTDQS